MRKKILIAVGIIIVSAGLALGALYLIQQAQPVKKADTPPPKTLVLDHSKDYGACALVDSSSIKKALGDSAKDLQKPEDVGIASNKAIGDGVKDLVSDSQRCVYAFIAGGTLENSFNAGNALTVERIVYTNESGPKTLIEQIKTQSVASPVEGIGDSAFYDATPTSTGPNAVFSARLELFVGKTSIRYIIRQPAETATFTVESAKTALVQLAKLAKMPNKK